MKKGTVLCALMLCAALAMAGCQPTPEKQAVVNKADGALEQKIAAPKQSEAAPSPEGTLYETLGAPKHLSEEREGGNDTLFFHTDADVTIPNIAQVGVARAKRRTFTQEEVDRVGEVLFGADAVYRENILVTKEWIEDVLVEERRFLAESEAAEDAVFAEKAKASIQYYESIYEDTPSVADIQETDLTLREITNMSKVETTQGIDVTCALGEEQFSFSVGNDLENGGVGMGASNVLGGYFSTVPIETPFGVELTKEQAAQKAQAVVAALGVDSDYTLNHVGITVGGETNAPLNWGWACVFMRTIGGCPATYTMDDVGSDMESQMTAPVQYEKIVVVVDDEGVSGFAWTNPLEITQIENENVALLSFDEIKERAFAQMEAKYAKYDMPDTGTLDVNVTGVRFGLTRVDRPDEGDYYYLPVWDFFNEPVYPQEPGAEPIEYIDAQGNVTGGMYSGYGLETYGSVTINAIDGSVIDRLTGH